MERKIEELFERASKIIECAEREDFMRGDYSLRGTGFRYQPKEVKISIPEGYEIDKEKSSFERIVFKKKQKIEKWDDLIGTIIPEKSFYVNTYSDIKEMGVDKFIEVHKNIFIDERHAKSALAMAQISQLIPYFGGSITNEEWERSEINKYCIIRCDKELIKVTQTRNFEFLSFHTPEQRDEFLKYNEQLVKDYLMIE